jgi:hypothetical protein
MLHSFLTMLLLLTAVRCGAAQSTDSAQQPPPPAAQATPPQATTPAPTTDPSAKKPKKVWTNEDLPEAHGSGPVVRDAKSTEKPKAQNRKGADSSYVANVKTQLEKLRGQIADSDKQIAKLKEFQSGEPVGTSDRQFHKGYNSEPIDRQIQTLEAKKIETQAKIDALLDEARKKGVEPGQLR